MVAPNVAITQRAVRYFDRRVRYEVTATVTEAGSLPFRDLFVLQVNDPLNPKTDTLARIAVPFDLRTEDDEVYIKVDSASVLMISTDTFLRIANIDELTTLPRDRVAAVRSGQTEYLAPTVSLIYEKLSTAEAAGRQIVDRLSKLVQDYDLHYNSFVTAAPVNYALPVTSRSVEAVLVAAYVSARDSRVAAEAVRDAAITARAACAEGDALLSGQLDKLVSDIAFLEAAKIVVTGLSETAAVVGGTCTVAPTAISSEIVKTFVLNAGDPRSYEALLVAKRLDLASVRTALNARAPQCATLTNRLAEAEANVTRTRAVEEAALREVYTSCPTFNPSTV